jgi:hypothetical protein
MNVKLKIFCTVAILTSYILDKKLHEKRAIILINLFLYSTTQDCINGKQFQTDRESFCVADTCFSCFLLYLPS